MRDALAGKLFCNDTYTVLVRDHIATSYYEKGFSFPDMVWLSIKRNDKEPIHDWRDLQEIKNKLVGEEHEAVEIYPAESRLTDTVNQYHLWCLKSSTMRFPFGFFDGRNVSYDSTEFTKQRPK